MHDCWLQLNSTNRTALGSIELSRKWTMSCTGSGPFQAIVVDVDMVENHKKKGAVRLLLLLLRSYFV
jgi:hypothetical protein